MEATNKLCKKVIVTVNGQKLHLVIGKTVREWKQMCGHDDSVWDISFEDLLGGAVEINQDIWYWYIDGRCYETQEEV